MQSSRVGAQVPSFLSSLCLCPACQPRCRYLGTVEAGCRATLEFIIRQRRLILPSPRVSRLLPRSTRSGYLPKVTSWSYFWPLFFFSEEGFTCFLSRTSIVGATTYIVSESTGKQVLLLLLPRAPEWLNDVLPSLLVFLTLYLALNLLRFNLSTSHTFHVDQL